MAFHAASVSVTTGTDLSLTLRDAVRLDGDLDVSVTTGTDLSLTHVTRIAFQGLQQFQLPPELIYH